MMNRRKAQEQKRLIGEVMKGNFELGGKGSKDASHPPQKISPKFN